VAVGARIFNPCGFNWRKDYHHTKHGRDEVISLQHGSIHLLVEYRSYSRPDVCADQTNKHTLSAQLRNHPFMTRPGLFFQPEKRASLQPTPALKTV